MASPAPESVIIVGGSLAGLMHALVLLSLPSPPKVRILERSPTNLLHDQGAGIVAGGDVQVFFDQYVRPGRDIAVKSPMRHYLDRHGKQIDGSAEHRQQHMTSWDLLYHLLRWRVDGLKSPYVKGLEADSRPKATYENGCTVTRVQETPRGIEVRWKSSSTDLEQSETADVVLAADGPSSSIRTHILPDIKRTYAGYVAWRGTVLESELSASATEAFITKFTFFHGRDPNIQILGYLIPAPPNGNLDPGQRRFNWVWYTNLPEGSPELEEALTDVNGRRHKITLPVGSMSPALWEKQKAYASEVLPPQFAEAVHKTEQPFIQAITDVLSPENSFYNGRLLLVGDAVAGFRPHTAASTGQAALDALYMGEWLRGEMDKRQYDESVMQYARDTQQHGVNLGQRSQFGTHPLNGWISRIHLLPGSMKPGSMRPCQNPNPSLKSKSLPQHKSPITQLRIAEFPDGPFSPA